MNSSPRRRWRTGCLLTTVAALLIPQQAVAFDPAGHELIEAKAYERLGKTSKGRNVLASLVKSGLLDPPQCVLTDSCHWRDEFWDLPLEAGAADHVLPRQWGSSSQCFHFLGETSDLPSNGKGLEELKTTAVARCGQMLSRLLDEAIESPLVAKDNFRGLYAMIHSVEDSFSEAHATRSAPQPNTRSEEEPPRPSDHPLSYLHVWHLLSFQNSVDDSVWHKRLDDRDKDYLLNAKEECRGHYDSDPHDVPERCLTKNALLAVSAVEELLIVVESLKSSGGSSRSSQWSDYMKSILGREVPATADGGQSLLRNEHAIPKSIVGIDSRLVRGSHAAVLALDVGVKIHGRSDPFNTWAILQPAISTEGRFVFHFGTRTLAPISYGWMIGGSPIAIAHYQGSGGWDAVASGPQVVYCCLGPLALTAAGPEFSLLHGRLGQTLAGLSIGYGFDRDATNPDDKETDPQAVDSWLKVGEGPEKPSANSFHETAFEEVSTAFGTHRDRVSLLFGVSGGLPLYARRWAALAFEGSSDLGYLRNADAKYAAYRAGAGARFHVRRVPILSLFSLIVMPIQVEGALGWRWRTDGWFTGQTGLAITIDRLELRVSSPRYVWRSRAWFNNEVAEIAAATKF